MSKPMSSAEKSLLLYLETRAVDHDGRLNQEQINDEEREILARWNESGFVESGRITYADHTKNGTAWARLSAAAMQAAHMLRAERAARGWERKGYTTTAEKRAAEEPPPAPEIEQ